MAVLMARRPNGALLAQDLERTSVEAVYERLAPIFAPGVLAEVEWICLPDGHALSSWPEQWR